MHTVGRQHTAFKLHIECFSVTLRQLQPIILVISTFSMILECPSCSKKFLVDPRALGASGRTVRCAACKNQWFATPSQEELATTEAVERRSSDESQADGAEAFGDVDPSAFDSLPDESKPRKRRSSLPAIPQAQDAPVGLKFACVSLAFLALILGAITLHQPILRAMPFTQSLYGLVGLYESDGVVLAELSYAMEPVGTKDRHALSGYLVNTGDTPRQLPLLRIHLLNEPGDLIRSRTLQEDSVTLAPGEQKMFSRYIDSSPESVHHIVMDVGSPLEVKLRGDSIAPIETTMTEEEDEHDG